jgi:isocitrate/isopropylmalate dehydrogenase
MLFLMHALCQPAVYSAEPIHGSAFDITRKGIANPIASFWTASQMRDHLREADASARLMRAVEKVTGAGILTTDVGGTTMTRAVLTQSFTPSRAPITRTG